MDNVIDCLSARGLVDAMTGDELKQIVQQPIRAYIGFDPTADSLHLGNLLGIVVLRWFQKFGHTPVVVLGGATGRIGDPSGKSKERPLLDAATIDYNVSRIRRHFEKVLDFSAPNAPIVVNNDEWFATFPLIDFLRDVGKHFRLGAMLAKESVRARVQSEEGMSFTEFTYQMLQAYDFYHLYSARNVILQMGGSDQWGNITAGVELVRKLRGEAVHGLTFPLLTRSDGKKFGKTEDGAIWLAEEKCSAFQFYQYMVRIADADVIAMMKRLTFMELEEIKEYESAMLRSDYVPNTAQKKLAEELTLLLHGKMGLETALKVTEGAAPGSQAVLSAEVFREIAKDMPNLDLPKLETVGQKFTDLAVKASLAVSKSEATRLVQGGGAYLNNQKVEDPNFRIREEDLIGGEYLLLGMGKKKKALIHVKG